MNLICRSKGREGKYGGSIAYISEDYLRWAMEQAEEYMLDILNFFIRISFFIAW